MGSQQLTEEVIADLLKKKLHDLSVEHRDLHEDLEREIAQTTRSIREKAEAEQIRALSEKLA